MKNNSRNARSFWLFLNCNIFLKLFSLCWKIEIVAVFFFFKLKYTYFLPKFSSVQNSAHKNHHAFVTVHFLLIRTSFVILVRFFFIFLLLCSFINAIYSFVHSFTLYCSRCPFIWFGGEIIYRMLSFHWVCVCFFISFFLFAFFHDDRDRQKESTKNE